MKLKKNLVLLGMMGCGKSTIGRLLAKKLDFRFIDIDAEIENKTNTKITELFKKNGEASFRRLEQKTSLHFLSKINCVISLGGGGFINDIIRSETEKKSITFWLNWKNKTLIERIRNNKKRPLTLHLNDYKLKNLMNTRSEIYSKSKYKIECENMTKLEIANEIMRIYENI
jgi:shikimate kinase